MELDVDNLILFFKKNTKSSEKTEFTEQDAAAPSSGGSGKTPKKWESGRKFGKTYMNDQSTFGILMFKEVTLIHYFIDN